MIIFLLLLTCCLLFTIFLYFRYANKNISFFISISVIIIWFIMFSMAILVPYDIYLITSIEKNETNDFDHELIKDITQKFFFIMQLFSIIILPMILEYELAGDFTFKERIFTAIKKNILFYLIVTALSVGFLIFLIIKRSVSLDNIMSFVISSTNAWGIFMIIFLNGFGLIAVPRILFNFSDKKLRIKKLEFSASGVSEEKEEMYEQVFKYIGIVKSMKILDKLDNTDTTSKISIMWNYILESDIENECIELYSSNKEQIDRAKEFLETPSKLAELNRKLKKSIFEYVRSIK
jgi:hypothetical protein